MHNCENHLLPNQDVVSLPQLQLYRARLLVPHTHHDHEAGSDARWDLRFGGQGMGRGKRFGLEPQMLKCIGQYCLQPRLDMWLWLHARGSGMAFFLALRLLLPI